MFESLFYFLNVALLFIAIAAFGEHYAMISSLAEKSGKDYAKHIVFGFEKNIKTYPWFIWPYMAHFPILFFGYIFILVVGIPNNDRTLLLMVGALLLDFTSFALFLLFPTKVTPLIGGLIDANSLSPGKTRDLIANTNNNMPLFNSLPSLHVSQGLWLGFALYELSAPLWLFVPYAIWFVLMCLGTVILKYHAILDGITGIILGTLVYLMAVSLDVQAIKSFMSSLTATISLLSIDVVLLYSAKEHSALLQSFLSRKAHTKAEESQNTPSITRAS